jgi:hypothetical protein
VRKKCCYAVAVVVLITAASLWADEARITVRVQNNSNMKVQTINKAEQTVARIFRGANQELAWINCVANQAQCKRPLESNELVIQLTSTTRERGLGVAASAFGVAFVPGDGSPARYALVFCDLLQTTVSNNPKVDLATALGHIMAHELGHLMLGSNSHSRTGIMQRDWYGPQLREAEQGTLRFDRVQARHIRAEAKTRCAAMHSDHSQSHMQRIE